MIVNVITKAVSKPFSLLGVLFGGGEELSSLELADGAGQAEQALADRPAPKLENTGHVNPETDRAPCLMVMMSMSGFRYQERDDTASRRSRFSLHLRKAIKEITRAATGSRASD